MDPGYFFPANLPTILTTTSVLEAQNHIGQATFTDQGFVAAGLGHSSYDEMIYTAITALKEGNGSSKKAIAKYIERVYSDLPLTHETLLAHQLKRLKDSGQIVLAKNSYKLPGSDTPHAASNPASQPGRRGRPPKLKPIPNTQPVLVSLGLVDKALALSSEKKGPGLPPKSGTQLEQGGTVLGKRGRGRPPGSKNMKLGPKGVKKGPGRPLKGQTPLVVIPYASKTIPSTMIGAESVPKRRGRLKKVATAAAVAVAAPAPPSTVNESGDTLNPSGVKKAIGRPKKYAPAAGNRVQLQDLNTNGYGELKRKFDFFQAKVKAAVDVIKPHISNATALSVLTVVQELDGLASTDVNVPLKDQTQTNS